MKSRSGFVSNSSTSSFICLGWREPYNTLKNLLFRYLDSKNIEYDEEQLECEDFSYFLEKLDDLDKSIVELNIHLDDNYYVTFGKEIIDNTDIDDLKKQIEIFEEQCKDKNHIYSYFAKLSKPSFIVDVIVDY